MPADFLGLHSNNRLRESAIAGDGVNLRVLAGEGVWNLTGEGDGVCELCTFLGGGT